MIEALVLHVVEITYHLAILSILTVIGAGLLTALAFIVWRRFHAVV